MTPDQHRSNRSAVPFPPTLSGAAPPRRPAGTTALAPPFVGRGRSAEHLPAEHVALQPPAADDAVQGPAEPQPAAVLVGVSAREAEPAGGPSAVAQDVRSSSAFTVPGAEVDDGPFAAFIDAGLAQPVFSHPVEDTTQEHAEAAHRLADRVEALGRRLRLEGEDALHDVFARGRPLEVALAGVLTAFLRRQD
jgi:hypothetical protein